MVAKVHEPQFFWYKTFTGAWQKSGDTKVRGARRLFRCGYVKKDAQRRYRAALGRRAHYRRSQY